MECKPLPDSAGLWIEERQPEVVYRILPEAAEEITVWGSMIGNDRVQKCVEGRWLKLELPTFPLREKCPVRLCWVQLGAGDIHRLAAWTEYGGYIICGGSRHFDVHSLQFITPEYLDELPIKDVAAPRVGT
jgi:hypothetical protein